MNFDLNFVFQCVLKIFSTIAIHAISCGYRVLEFYHYVEQYILLSWLKQALIEFPRVSLNHSKKGRLVFQIELRILALQNRCTVLLKLVKVPFGFRMHVLILFCYFYLFLFSIHLPILISCNQWKNYFKLHSYGFFKGLLWDKYSVTSY